MSLQHPPVLLYHKVTSRWEVGITWTPPGAFQQQMENLARSGWCSAGLGQIAPFGRTFHIVFDDGYQCVLDHALPVLQKLGFTATLFMPSGYINRWNDWDHQLLGRRFRHLDRSGLRLLQESGWTIGSHSVHHTSLVGQSTANISDELIRSRSDLEEILCEPIHWIAFPFGRYDSKVLEMAAQAGYQGAVVPVLRHGRGEANILLYEADAVYLWDSASGPASRVARDGTSYRLGKLLRRSVNTLSGGTLLWRRLFPPR